MPTLNFYLSEPKSTNSSIYFRLNYGAFEIVNGKKRYLPMQYHVDEQINFIYWNKEKGKVRETKAFPQYSEFNARLNNIRDTALDIFRRLKNDGAIVNNDVLRKEFDLVFRNDRDQGQNSDKELMSFIAYFIKTCTWSTATKKSYNITFNNLRDYEQLRKIKLTYNKITIDFYNDFVDFLQLKDYTPNTIGTRIKILKTFMNEAYERGLHSNLDYKKKGFSKPLDETKKIYLNKKELQSMYELDLSNSKKYEQVRDWFLISAYTGLRFSDLASLTEKNFKDDFIEIRTKKTTEPVVIPKHKIVREILEKYDNKLPRIISNQNFNVYIKEIAKMAEIAEDELIEETKGKEKKSRTEKKYNLVSVHTARRSFATNAYLAGIPSIQIMKITGHKTEEAFLSYIRIGRQENAQKLLSHSFFN